MVAVGRAVQGSVGGGEGFQDLSLRGDDVEFDVGFADVEDGNEGRVVVIVHALNSSLSAR